MQDTSVPGASPGAELTPGERFPWSGNVLSPTAASVVSVVQRPTLIGLAGLTDSGKTSFLATLYVLLKQRHALEGGRFAGSYSLIGWERIAHAFHWRKNIPPGYPARTSGYGRTPGLLHLRLKDASSRVREVLLTDAAGEWYHHWIEDQDVAEAEGARQTVERADRLLLFVDSAALGHPEQRHRAVSDTQTLTDRLAQAAGKRPVGVVWAKADTLEDTPQVQRVRQHLHKRFPDTPHFHSIAASAQKPGEPHLGVLEVINWALGRGSGPLEPAHEPAALERGARLLGWTRGMP